MKTAFIRHMFSDLPTFINTLWERREIAIHYHNIPSTDPNDFPQNNGKNAIRRLNNYCKEGVIIAAKYKKIHPEKILVGVIPKGSPIFIQTIDRDSEPQHFKCVKLINAKEVSLCKYPLLAAIQPRGGAITGWPSAAIILNYLIDGKTLEPDVSLLSPGQLEVLCHEYLRKEGMLDALLLPIGRNLLDVDIIGIKKGSTHKIYAQVTQESSQHRVEEKINTLKHYRVKKNELIFFGPQSCKTEIEDIRYITIESVFDNLKNNQVDFYQRIITEIFIA